jgi:cbb3-type cytochrome oxidase maturation protein
MSVLYIALPIALLLGASGMIACIRCIKSGQYDDLESPPMRMLIDNETNLKK